MTDALRDILRYVERELGFATSYYNESYLGRRITARIRRSDAEGREEYLAILRNSAAEQDALLDSFSINVTSFFRDPDVWENLRTVLRTLTRERRDPRLWSAPCSDGREPYSLAMLALDDPGVDASRIRITGTDISEEALDAARAGRYQTTRLTDIESELAPLDDYAPYVDRDGDRFEVTDRVRRLVTFERHDLIRDDPIGEFDLVLCRNLLIYIAPEYEEPIFETLDSALTDDGYLVLGTTETMPRSYASRYEPIGNDTRIQRRTA